MLIAQDFFSLVMLGKHADIMQVEEELQKIREEMRAPRRAWTCWDAWEFSIDATGRAK